jgi:predicted HD superfamily hydrolase involved in NAD metabolism
MELAPVFGADPKKAVIAAILHDIARGYTPAELLRVARSQGIMVRTADVVSPILLHGKIAAAIARECGITDASILDAIAWHVTGRPGWTSLEKVVYLADKVEENRDYPGVQEVRELVRAGKPVTALRESLRNAIMYAAQTDPFFVDPETVVVFNEVSQGLAQAPER